MSNINPKSSITKLRNNETSKVRTYNRPNPDSGLQVDSVASGSLRITKVPISKFIVRYIDFIMIIIVFFTID